MLIYLMHALMALTPPPNPPPDPGMTSSWVCPWLCSPDGPSTPFATPLLTLADSIRVICFLLGLITISKMPAAIAHAKTRYHRMRFYALAAFILVAVTTEAVHMGDTPSYRLALNALGCVAAVYGMSKYYDGDEVARTASR
jgi:hypothetical protein